jgi:predicted small secreted protein
MALAIHLMRVQVHPRRHRAEREITMFRRLFAAATLIASVGAVVGCNTVAGAGKDVERGGEKIQESARDVQKKM